MRRPSCIVPTQDWPVIVFRDVTEKRRYEEEQQKAEKLESLGGRSHRRALPHDFNNLLTAILGNLSARACYPRLGDEIAERLNAAKKASNRAEDSRSNC